jgi:hypothetical protein
MDRRLPFPVRHRTLLTVVALLLPGATLGAQAWTNWTASTLSSGTTNGTAAGSLVVGGSTVGVSFTGDVFSTTQTACGFDYWAFNSAVYTSPANGLTTRPTACEQIGAVGGAGRPVTQTLTFSQALVNPVMAILSLGQPSIVVTYNFNTPFDVLSSGTGNFGGSAAGSLFEDPGNVLRGIEGHGLIRFNGTVSSISWTVPTAENWHSFTVGAAAAEDGPTTTVPEPASLALLTAGALVLGGVARARRR